VSRYDALAAGGIDPRDAMVVRHAWTPDEVQQAVDLRASGIGCREIAARVGHPFAAVRSKLAVLKMRAEQPDTQRIGPCCWKIRTAPFIVYCDAPAEDRVLLLCEQHRADYRRSAAVNRHATSSAPTPAC